MYVQILTNKPRSIFYIAVITSPPKEDTTDFRLAMLGAPWPGQIGLWACAIISRSRPGGHGQGLSCRRDRRPQGSSRVCAEGRGLQKSSDDRPGE